MPDNKKGFVWTKEKVHKLISLYEENDCLWNCTIESYKDKEKRLEIVKNICKTMCITKEQFARKIHNLRNQFNFEIKKVHKRKVDDSTVNEYTTKWEYFERLQFLKKFITSRPNFESVEYEIKNVAVVEEATLNNNHERKSKIINQEPAATIKDQQTSVSLKTGMQDSYTTADNSADAAVYHYNQPENLNTNENQITTDIQHEKPHKKFRPNRIVEHSRDEFEIFGQFVATELRGLNSTASRKKLRRRILQAILEVGNEDDGININIKLT